MPLPPARPARPAPLSDMAEARNRDVLSKRAEDALAILAKGGTYVCRLERNSYTGRDVFQYRLLANWRPIRGFGISTFRELKARELIRWQPDSTPHCEIYRITDWARSQSQAGL